MNSASLGKTQSPVSGICYARNRVCKAVFLTLLRTMVMTAEARTLLGWYRVVSKCNVVSQNMPDVSKGKTVLRFRYPNDAGKLGLSRSSRTSKNN